MRVKLIVLLVLIITTFVWAKDENENILEKYMNFVKRGNKGIRKKLTIKSSIL